VDAHGYRAEAGALEGVHDPRPDPRGIHHQRPELAAQRR
jgi:hypothetical protein